jgi:hypothetical protein
MAAVLALRLSVLTYHQVVPHLLLRGHLVLLKQAAQVAAVIFGV